MSSDGTLLLNVKLCQLETQLGEERDRYAALLEVNQELESIVQSLEARPVAVLPEWTEERTEPAQLHKGDPIRGVVELMALRRAWNLARTSLQAVQSDRVLKEWQVAVDRYEYRALISAENSLRENLRLANIQPSEHRDLRSLDAIRFRKGVQI